MKIMWTEVVYILFISLGHSAPWGSFRLYCFLKFKLWYRLSFPILPCSQANISYHFKIQIGKIKTRCFNYPRLGQRFYHFAVHGYNGQMKKYSCLTKNYLREWCIIELLKCVNWKFLGKKKKWNLYDNK